ncbi:bifunctional 23S rRNA (guanine(2069)-N(7))-methyltransferase RlmK/23S rRNA (guanine(2445)-N(2))-methyltransferase RlmL [Alteromonas halophila]|uniref:Ribosomal RNA large subunit methyltransferase K/L n=1 Tax=Alteromonas halophila TaxID=516698 RepID=A0A918MZC1_9ALTE|nr:bifunctional 23S rRNA (guanine(2069)-N(7))-methyltransferase RlmK/23S rRNA (guanine(2445)-N(2))-methyltransferase RlmL [Alteromonas halophila]GGW88537.1 ribosomal RNA large subunit methyltransferase K/L [Alteromonas halophila]
MNTFFVTTSKGLDELLLDEVARLCPSADAKLRAGVIQVQGSLSDAYTLCLWSRLANRVVWVLAEGPAKDADSLYATADSIDWPMQMTVNHTLSVHFVGSSREINNTQFGAVRVKDAIVDQFTELEGKRPSVARQQPDIPVYARLRKDTVTIGIDLAGASLHQRAYRQDTGAAPLKEHLACAMLMRSGWVDAHNAALVDPMCGSGTIAIEAAYIARNIAPGIKRDYWGFSQWLGHQQATWETLVSDALSQQKASAGIPIQACDNSKKMIAMARKNADVAGVYQDIAFSVQDARNVTPTSQQPGYIVSNPPYGERLGELTDLIPLFSEWGKHLKGNWSGWKLTLLTSNRDLMRVMKLRASKAYAMNNGKLACQLLNFALESENLAQFGADADDHPFANRVRKNLKRLKGWLKKQQTNCYRIYDADLPEYNVAVDRYDDYLVVQEYAPPKNIPEEKARRRLQEALLHLPAVTGVSAKNIALKVRAQQKGSQQYEKLDKAQQTREVFENGARFLVNLTDYLDTGLFLDHRITRQLVRERAKDKDVLNLFCYTGSVSVFAAQGGARSVTSVDMSNTYLDWAKQNFRLNKLNGAYAFIQADCTQWLDGHNGTYDLMFIDPPSFSNSKRMQSTWDVQRDHVALLQAAYSRLREKGQIVFSNNKRGFKLDHKALSEAGFAIEDISRKTIPEDFSRNTAIHQCWILTR